MYSTYNEGKYVVAERFIIRTLKDKIYKYMTSISKNLSIDKLDYIVNKYNNTHQINGGITINVVKERYGKKIIILLYVIVKMENIQKVLRIIQRLFVTKFHEQETNFN